VRVRRVILVNLLHCSTVSLSAAPSFRRRFCRGLQFWQAVDHDGARRRTRARGSSNVTMALSALTSAMLITSMPVAAISAAMPVVYAQQVTTAQRLGAALYHAEKLHPQDDGPRLAAARERLPELCNFTYKPVSIALDGQFHTYFIAHGTPDTDIVIGRHYRVDGDAVISSSKACVNLGTPPMDTKFVTVVHLMSAVPTEFHVLQSLPRAAALAHAVCEWGHQRDHLSRRQGVPEGHHGVHRLPGTVMQHQLEVILGQPLHPGIATQGMQ
jgi:hypothetical protein